MRRVIRPYIVQAIVVAAIYLLAGCNPSNWNNTNIAESKKRGECIVAALNSYYGDHGRYPDRLNQLVPKYLRNIDSPVAGDRKWIYELKVGGRHCALSFEEPGPPPRKGYEYSFSASRWIYSDGAF